jgi:hypothetical protein
LKYLLIIFPLFICSALIYKYFIADDLPSDLVKKIDAQRNPFTAPKDSAELIWQRAKEFLYTRRRLITGGKMQQTDSLMVIPYYNSYHKGNAVKIERKTTGDSVAFSCSWWYSGIDQPDGAKEIALFMQTGIGIYESYK